MDDRRIIAVVLNPDMIRIAKPRLECGNHFRSLGALRDIANGVFAASMITRMRYETGRDD